MTEVALLGTKYARRDRDADGWEFAAVRRYADRSPSERQMFIEHNKAKAVHRCPVHQAELLLQRALGEGMRPAYPVTKSEGEQQQWT
jgi:hypothetical protein